jgi:hypothetical protein
MNELRQKVLRVFASGSSEQLVVILWLIYRLSTKNENRRAVNSATSLQNDEIESARFWRIIA